MFGIGPNVKMEGVIVMAVCGERGQTNRRKVSVMRRGSGEKRKEGMSQQARQREREISGKDVAVYPAIIPRDSDRLFLF